VLPRFLDGVQRSDHFEHRVPVSSRRDDVGTGVGLDALDRRALGADDQSDHAHRYPNPQGGRRRRSGARRGGSCLAMVGVGSAAWTRSPTACARRGRRPAGVMMTSTGSDLGEVLGGGHDLSPRGVDVLPPARHHEHRLFASHRRLDVRVRLVSQRLDLATFHVHHHTVFSDVFSGVV